VAIGGEVPVQVSVSNATHTRAVPVSGTTASLASAASGGVPVVWPRPFTSTGVQWAVVLLGDNAGAGCGTVTIPHARYRCVAGVLKQDAWTQTIRYEAGCPISSDSPVATTDIGCCDCPSPPPPPPPGTAGPCVDGCGFGGTRAMPASLCVRIVAASIAGGGSGATPGDAATLQASGSCGNWGASTTPAGSFASTSAFGFSAAGYRFTCNSVTATGGPEAVDVMGDGTGGADPRGRPGFIQVLGCDPFAAVGRAYSSAGSYYDFAIDEGSCDDVSTGSTGTTASCCPIAAGTSCTVSDPAFGTATAGTWAVSAGGSGGTTVVFPGGLTAQVQCIGGVWQYSSPSGTRYDTTSATCGPPVSVTWPNGAAFITS
jgi:hypothetical protein